MYFRTIPVEIKTIAREPVIVELSTVEYFILAHKEHALEKLSRPSSKKSPSILSLLNICLRAILRCRLPIASLPMELKKMCRKRNTSWHRDPNIQHYLTQSTHITQFVG